MRARVHAAVRGSAGCLCASAGCLGCPRRLAAQRRRGPLPARLQRRVDRADVGLDEAAAARQRRVGHQPRAARGQRVAGAQRDQRVVVRVHAQRDVARAHQQRVDGFLRHGGDQFRARRQFGAHDLARHLRGRRGDGQRHLLLQRVELALVGLGQRAELRRHLARVGLLEGLERDQAVAVAVLVARLARGAQLRGERVGDAAGVPFSPAGWSVARRSGASGTAPPDSAPGFHAANAPSSSRGMKRA